MLSLVIVLAIVAADAKAVELFDGSTLKGWKMKGDAKRSKWAVGIATLDEKNPSKLAVKPVKEKGEMVNASGSVDAYSEKTFGDCTIEVEFMVPKGSNSGVYVMGEYEVQILDSYGKKKVGPGDLGGLYSAAAPKVNAAKKPGEWQKFVIEFEAPKFKDGKKVKNAKFVKVTLNGTVIHENVEMKGPTPGGLTGKEKAEGPVMFQGDHGPVTFRNVRVTPK
jgi:hypothetical protein